jgi:biopolymer transport protein ExbD
MSSPQVIDETSPGIDADDAPLTFRRRAGNDAELDVTPMIDMVFLLLIFFLVTSQPDQQTSVDLPEAHYGVPVSQLDAVVFTIGEGSVRNAPVYAADGRISGTELPEDASERREEIRRLVEKGRGENKGSVMIKADKNVAHREVAAIIKAASQVEGVKIHLAVLEDE